MQTVLDEDGDSTHDPECISCVHDCPWHAIRYGTVPQPLGAPFCGVCDDHGEAVHVGCGLPETPCDCGDKHDWED